MVAQLQNDLEWLLLLITQHCLYRSFWILARTTTVRPATSILHGHSAFPNLCIYFNLYLKKNKNHTIIPFPHWYFLLYHYFSCLSAFSHSNGPELVPGPMIYTKFSAAGQIWTQYFSPLYIQESLRDTQSYEIGSPSPATCLKHPILRFSTSVWIVHNFANWFCASNLELLQWPLQYVGWMGRN